MAADIDDLIDAPPGTLEHPRDLVGRDQPQIHARIRAERKVVPGPLVEVPLEMQDSAHRIEPTELVPLDVADHVEGKGSRPRCDVVPAQEIEDEPTRFGRMCREPCQESDVVFFAAPAYRMVQAEDYIERFPRSEIGESHSGCGRVGQARPEVLRDSPPRRVDSNLVRVDRDDRMTRLCKP